MVTAIAGVLFLLVFGAMIGALVFWILKIVEVAQLPEAQYRAAGTDKTVWVLVVLLLGFLGALAWQFAKREDVRRAAGAAAFGPPPPVLPPPGWYPDPGSGWFAYWDGYRWTDARMPPQPPAARHDPVSLDKPSDPASG